MSEKVKFKIIDLDCPDCAARLEGNIAKLKGIIECRLDFTSASVNISYDKSVLDIHKISNEIAGLGHKAVTIDEIQAGGAKSEVRHFSLGLKDTLLIIAIISMLLELSLTIIKAPQYLLIVCAALAIITGGLFIFRSAFFALKNLSADMNLLMTIAVIGAAVIGEWSEAAVTIVLFSLANYLEGKSVRKAHTAFKSLSDQIPREIECEVDGGIRAVRPDQLNPGDLIHLKPGMTCPTDCEIVEGKAYINQAAVTGESAPVSMGEKDTVLGGSINTDGFLRLKVLKRFSDSTLSKIVQMVEEASGRKARLANLIDRFARVYTPIVVGLALLVAVIPPLLFAQEFEKWFYRALVFLVISCPCALVISTPVAVICSLTRAARDGILIKGGIFLEKLAGLKGALLDKTGTLTRGSFSVTDVVAINEHGENEVVSIAASIEQYSEHPIARAILEYASEKNIGYDQSAYFKAFPGEGARGRIGEKEFMVGSHRFFHERGICDDDLHTKVAVLENEGKSLVLLSDQERLIGAIALSDQAKPNAKTAINDLHNFGLKDVIMLTGDNQPSAEYMARQLGIDKFESGLLPHDKNRQVAEYQSRLGSVAMVGDGINDAPALASADVGIAMGTGGSDIAIEAADVAIIGDNPAMVPRAIGLSKRALNIIKFNIVFALATKFVFMVLASMGLATLWMAVAADMGTSLLVIANSLRLLRK
jgi:Cd2+/Zn2+-exporting ATPase